MRQNTASLRTENYVRGLERIAATQSLLSQSGELAAMHARGVLDAASLTPQERIQFTWWFAEAFGAFEFMFHQFQGGALPEEVWQRWSASIAWWVSYPGVQAWWSANPAPFSESFTAFVDDCIRHARFDEDGARRWQEFVQGTPRGASPRQPDA